MNIAGIRFVQSAFVVADLESAARALDRAVGRGEWTVYHLDDAAFAERVHRGETSAYTLRHAISWRDDEQYELCQPLGGPSVWQEQLDAGRTGLHHVGAYVTDLDGATERLERHGWLLVQVGRGFGATGDGEFRYFEHEAVPFLAELISPPSRRRPAAATIRTEEEAP